VEVVYRRPPWLTGSYHPQVTTSELCSSFAKSRCDLAFDCECARGAASATESPGVMWGLSATFPGPPALTQGRERAVDNAPSLAARPPALIRLPPLHPLVGRGAVRWASDGILTGNMGDDGFPEHTEPVRPKTLQSVSNGCKQLQTAANGCKQFHTAAASSFQTVATIRFPKGSPVHTGTTGTTSRGR
jgi:hypothetical protein